MSGTDDNHDIAQRFAGLWAAIRASERPLDIIDRMRDALDRKADVLARERPLFIEGSFALDAVTYQTDTTQMLRVTHRDLGTVFAIKTMPEQRRGDALLVQRLRREAQIGLALRHLCLQETSALLRLPDGRPGLLQPWAPVSLASLLGTRNVTPDEITILLHRILGAVAAMHAEGYVHCDITPSNILAPDGNLARARLGDFGIALKIGRRHSDEGIEYAGSPEFSAPEQIAGAPAHPHHDIYATGKLTERLLSVSTADTAGELTAFAQRCTEKDARKRPQSAEKAFRFLSSG